MRSAYIRICTLLVCLIGGPACASVQYQTNCPSCEQGGCENGLKSTFKAEFEASGKGLIVNRMNEYQEEIIQVVVNFGSGGQFHYKAPKKTTYPLSFNFSDDNVYGNDTIIGVWIATANNSKKTSTDPSGYGDYILNPGKAGHPMQDFQTDLCQGTTGSGQGRVLINHAPDGVQAGPHAIYVSSLAAPAHLDRHSYNEVSEAEEAIEPVLVELVSFSALMLEPKLVELQWTTESEVNNDYIAIERTSDMKNWKEVCRVAGHGTTGVPHDYTCTDTTAHSHGTQEVYYRQKQVDYSGAFEYFNTVKLRMASIHPQDLIENIYPNPASDRLIIQHRADVNSLVDIRLTTLEGRTMLASQYTVEPGYRTFDLDLPETKLVAGVYILEVESEGEVFRQKIYKR